MLSSWLKCERPYMTQLNALTSSKKHCLCPIFPQALQESQYTCIVGGSRGLLAVSVFPFIWIHWHCLNLWDYKARGDLPSTLASCRWTQKRLSFSYCNLYQRNGTQGRQDGGYLNRNTRCIRWRKLKLVPPRSGHKVDTMVGTKMWQ